MAHPNKSSFVTLRVTEQMHKLFIDKAHTFGTPSDVLRELIDAFISDRVTINPLVIRNVETENVTRIQD